MTHEAFNDYQAKLLAEVVGMKDTKGREYSHSDDRFANFNRLSEALGIPNYQIGWVYAMKHKDGIESYIKDGKEHSTEGVRGRIVDLITYLTLIGGMIEEEDNIAFCCVAEPLRGIVRCYYKNGHEGEHSWEG